MKILTVDVYDCCVCGNSHMQAEAKEEEDGSGYSFTCPTPPPITIKLNVGHDDADAYKNYVRGTKAD